MLLAYRLSARLRHTGAAHPYWWSIVVVGLVTGVLWLLRPHINEANTALFYLVAVLLCAAMAGPAVFGAVIGFLAFKFFFVPPIFVLTIENGS